MKSSEKKSNFGQLLDAYRRERRISQLNLERALNQKGYPITNGLISKYEHGKIDPSPEFIHAVVIYIDLSQEEAGALIEAHLADVALRFWNRYNRYEAQISK